MRSPHVRRKIAFTFITIVLIIVIYTKYITQFNKNEISEEVSNDEYKIKLKKSEEHNMKVEVFYESRKVSLQF